MSIPNLLKLSITLTTPWWACEYHHLLLYPSELIVKNIKTVAIDPAYLIIDTINFSVNFGAFDSLGVNINSDDFGPSTRGGKCYRVTTYAAEAVNQDSFGRRRIFSNMFCYLATVISI
jgi:hypothetical protein